MLDAFWYQIAYDWILKVGLPTDHAEMVFEAGMIRLYDRSRRDHSIFSIFEDTVPALDRLKAKGFRMAVLSNWDYSIHRVMKLLKLDGYFERIYASLEEGVEKPDPRLFEIMLNGCGVSAGNVIHVGDSPTDDLLGAQNAGIKAVLIDRANEPNLPTRIASLLDLIQVLDCC